MTKSQIVTRSKPIGFPRPVAEMQWVGSDVQLSQLFAIPQGLGQLIQTSRGLIQQKLEIVTMVYFSAPIYLGTYILDAF